MERDEDRDKTWEQLGALDDDGITVGKERLEAMAAAALKDEAWAAPAAPVRSLPRLLARVAAAAALLLAVSLGVRFAFDRHGGGPDVPPLAPPACLDDPDFVTNFDLIRDLPDLDADGDLLDVDDETLILQALEGA